jgi:hypothetical protein
MAKINRTKTKAAIKYAASKDVRSLKRDTLGVLKCDALPVLGSSLKLMKFTELNGVKQLRATTADKAVVESHWAAIEEFVAAHVLFVSDVKGKLSAATRDLEAFDGSAGKDMSVLLDGFCELFDICSSWLGSEFENDFKKIQRFLSKCPSSIQREYADFISPKCTGERIDELSMEWGDFEVLIGNVWVDVSVKENILSEFDLNNSQVDPGGKGEMQRTPPSVSRPQLAIDPVNFRDIDCDTCKKAIAPSSKQVEII